jgi:hypothetical protein
MQSTNSNQPSLDMRYRTLLILWCAIWMSVLFFLVLVYLTPAQPKENRSFSLLLNAIGIAPVALSFLFKKKILVKSVESQQPAIVNSAYVLSFALCEVPALFAVMDHFVTGSTYYFAGFAIAGIGLLMHFPQKKHLADASYKQL